MKTTQKLFIQYTGQLTENYVKCTKMYQCFVQSYPYTQENEKCPPIPNV